MIPKKAAGVDDCSNCLVTVCIPILDIHRRDVETKRIARGPSDVFQALYSYTVLSYFSNPACVM